MLATREDVTAINLIIFFNSAGLSVCMTVSAFIVNSRKTSSVGSPSDSRNKTGATEPEARFMKPCEMESFSLSARNAAPIDV